MLYGTALRVSSSDNFGHVEMQTMQTVQTVQTVETGCYFFYLYLNFLVKFLLL